MNIDLAWFTAVVDVDEQSVNGLTNALRAGFNEHPDYEQYDVRGFTDAEQLLRHINEVARLSVPKVIVADSAARSPSVREGVFARLRDVVPRCWPVFYSGTMDGRDEMDRLGIRYSAVRRDREDGIEELTKTILAEIRAFEESPDRGLIEEFLEGVRAAADPWESSLDDEEGDLSPMQMLIEVARQTEKGRGYIRDLVPWRRSRPSEKRD